jgi:hypothetical protein
MDDERARYRDLVELARICAYQARVTKDRNVAAELQRMANEYKQRAAELDNGRIPDLGET